jgi:hypothetical protein
LDLTDSVKFYKGWREPYSVLGDGSFTLAASGRPPRPKASFVFHLLSFRESRQLHALKLIPVKEKLLPFLSLYKPIALVAN